MKLRLIPLVSINSLKQPLKHHLLQQPTTLRWHCMSSHSLHLYLSLLCLQTRGESTLNKAKHGNAASVFSFSTVLSFLFVRQKKSLIVFPQHGGLFPLKLIDNLQTLSSNREEGEARFILQFRIYSKADNKDIRGISCNNSAEGWTIQCCVETIFFCSKGLQSNVSRIKPSLISAPVHVHSVSFRGKKERERVK